MSLGAAVVDRVIPDNPCSSIRVSSILRGLSRAPKWVPTTEQALALLDVVPDRFLAAIWLGAGEGLRLGEMLAIEDSTRCVDRTRDEVHVVQQLRFHRLTYGGSTLRRRNRARSVTSTSTTRSPRFVAGHVKAHSPVTVVLPDITRGTPSLAVSRSAGP
jgi:hypothetical protein